MKNLIRRFHNDQRGSNSLEQIVIFALGVMVLAGVWYVWKEMPTGEGGKNEGGLFSWLETGIQAVTDWNFGGKKTP